MSWLDRSCRLISPLETTLLVLNDGKNCLLEPRSSSVELPLGRDFALDLDFLEAILIKLINQLCRF